MKKIAVFDIDGTLFRWQLYHETVLVLNKRGLFAAETSEQLMTTLTAWQSRQQAFSTFERTAIQALEGILPTLSTEQVEEIVQEILHESGHKVYRYTRALVEQCQSENYFILAISGSQHEIAEPFSKLYGFDDCIGWVYEQENGKYTGTTTRDTVSNKAQLLEAYVKENNLTLEDSIGIGDSKSDISMLEKVSHPIAFNPSEELLAHAQQAGWKIVIERKNIAYTLETRDGTVVLAKTDIY